MDSNMVSILIFQIYGYIYYISFLTFLCYFFWKQNLCLVVIDRNVYNGFTLCYNIGLSPPALGERVCLHVCVWVCVLEYVYVCVGIMLACVFLI